MRKKGSCDIDLLQSSSKPHFQHQSSESLMELLKNWTRTHLIFSLLSFLKHGSIIHFFRFPRNGGNFEDFEMHGYIIRIRYSSYLNFPTSFTCTETWIFTVTTHAMDVYHH